MERKTKIVLYEENLSPDEAFCKSSDIFTLSLINTPRGTVSDLSQQFEETKIEYNFLQAIYGLNRTIIIVSSCKDNTFIHSIECRTIFGKEKYQIIVKNELCEKKFIAPKDRITPKNILIKDTDVDLETFLYSLWTIYGPDLNCFDVFSLGIACNNNILKKEIENDSNLSDGGSPPDISKQGTGTFENDLENE